MERMQGKEEGVRDIESDIETERCCRHFDHYTKDQGTGWQWLHSSIGTTGAVAALATFLPEN